MDNIKLTAHEFIRLAELFKKTGLEELTFKPTEGKLLFDLDNPVGELSEFYWNIKGNFIRGKIQEKNYFFPPKMLIEDYIDDLKYHPYATIAAILQYIERSLTSEHLLENIQFQLHEKFEYLSLGQARAIVKRKLRISLSSAERNDLSRLRRKFEGYKTLIDAFQGMVDKYTDSDLGLISSNFGLSTADYIASVRSKLHFMCWECKTYIDFPNSSGPMTPPIHHGKPMSISWSSSHLSANEMTEATLELQEAVLLRGDSLTRIEPLQFSQNEQWDILRLIKQGKKIIQSVERMSGVDDTLLELIFQAKGHVQSIDIDDDSYGRLMQKLRNARNTILQMERTSSSSQIRSKMRQVNKIVDEIEHITRTQSGTQGGAGFQPAQIKRRLTPIPREREKETVTLAFKCVVCGHKESPTWKFVKKQSSRKNDIVDLPTHCENQMALIIAKE